MEKLTRKKVDLLEKLFNLSTDESTLISGINDKIASLKKEEIIEKETKKELEDERKKLETEMLTFSSQAKDFLNIFGKYNNSSFDKLKKIDIDLELGTIVSQVRKNVPVYEKEINKELKEKVNGISSCNKKINKLEQDQQKTNKELDEAKELKTKLADLLDDILVNNNTESYTRGFINKILTELNTFSEEDVKELEFLILFPERGLKLYEEYKNNPYPLDSEEIRPEDIPQDEFIDMETEIEVPSLKEEVKPIILGPTLKETMEAMNYHSEEEETKEDNETTEETKEENEDIIRPTLKETIEAKSYEQPKETEDEAKEYVYEEETPEEVEKVVEEIKSEDEFNQELETIGIDVNAIDISNRSKVIDKLKHTDSKIIKNNYELLKSLDVDNECLYGIENNYMYLTDEELNNKITIIRSKGIKDNVIKNHLIASGLKMTVDELGNRIKSLTDSGEELKDSTLYLLEHDLKTKDENITKLADAGIELDDKEKRNYMAVLERCHNIDQLINLLSTYVVNLSKRNGKFELNILLNNSKDLLFNMDDLTEKGLEDQVSETPEIFDYNIDAVLDRINYCMDNNIPLYGEEDNIINEYVYDARAFKEQYSDAKVEKLLTREEANKRLKDAFQDEYVNKIVETLDKYYNELKEYENVNVVENKNLYDKLLDAIEKELDITPIGKNTAKYKTLLISKNKLERNLAIIVNNYKELDNVEENISKTVLVAALYNIRDNSVDNIIEKYKEN